MLRGIVWVCVALVCATGAVPAKAVTLGQIDTFEDGTTQNWVINLLGSGAPPAAALPANIASGGPDGANDNFLQLTSLGGAGGGSRLSGINVTQWTGDYLAAGIDSIRLQARNFGPSDLALRLLFADPTGGPPSNIAITDAILLVAGGGWTPLTFSIDPADMTAFLGSAVDALSNATELRIFHGADPIFPGPAIAAVLGVDNIEAAADAITVPEPPGFLMMMAGLLAWAGVGRKGRRSHSA